MKLAVAGASGFIGSSLVPFLRDQGHEVVCLVRRPRAGCIYWNPEAEHIDLSRLKGVEGFINLCGESVLGRWTQKKMERIRESRFVSTEFLVKSMLQLDPLPKLYIGASAIGYYGDRGSEELCEKSSSGHGYLSQVCRTWEALSDPLKERKIRVVRPRIGVVLGKGGGVLKKLIPPFRLGLGGRLGSGQQYFSWIALDDILSGFEWLIKEDTVSGPVNFVAPNPITNQEFTTQVGKLLHRPTPFPLPRYILTGLFGSGADIFLASLKVCPEVLLKAKFRYKYPKIEDALKKYLPIKS